MDALTLGMFLSLILTVTTVWNTGETGDMYSDPVNKLVTKQLGTKNLPS